MEEQKKTESKKKGVLMAIAVLLAFFFVSKLLSGIATNPSQIAYENKCASCHGLEGEGVKEMIPPLANSDWLVNNQETIACVIKYGVKGPMLVNGKEYDIEMLGQKKMKDIELTNIINYINTSWGNTISPMKNVAVIEQLKNCN
jgi:mono/diheme cytochrome c family protein